MNNPSHGQQLVDWLKSLTPGQRGMFAAGVVGSVMVGGCLLGKARVLSNQSANATVTHTNHGSTLHRPSPDTGRRRRVIVVPPVTNAPQVEQSGNTIPHRRSTTTTTKLRPFGGVIRRTRGHATNSPKKAKTEWKWPRSGDVFVGLAGRNSYSRVTICFLESSKDTNALRAIAWIGNTVLWGYFTGAIDQGNGRMVLKNAGAFGRSPQTIAGQDLVSDRGGFLVLRYTDDRRLEGNRGAVVVKDAIYDPTLSKAARARLLKAPMEALARTTYKGYADYQPMPGPYAHQNRPRLPVTLRFGAVLPSERKVGAILSVDGMPQMRAYLTGAIHESGVAIDFRQTGGFYESRRWFNAGDLIQQARNANVYVLLLPDGTLLAYRRKYWMLLRQSNAPAGKARSRSSRTTRRTR